MATATLADRGVVRLSGEDARSFLNGLVTADLGAVGEDRPRYAALLSPQGKILFDFIVAEADGEQGGQLYLDTPRSVAADLAKRLGFYKLRAKVVVEDVSATLAVVAYFDGERAPNGVGVIYPDPRHAGLGDRVIMDRSQAEALGGDAGAWQARRIGLGVPEALADFAYGDAFPHEADMDQLGGVDFDKGCYVGQEVVSRMHHRGTARTRVVPVQFEGDAPPAPGTDASADGKPIGRVCSVMPAGHEPRGRGLAMLRLDRVEDALASGLALEAGGVRFRLLKPDFATFPVPGAA